jgi:hypothetical protein
MFGAMVGEPVKGTGTLVELVVASGGRDAVGEGGGARREEKFPMLMAVGVEAAVEEFAARVVSTCLSLRSWTACWWRFVLDDCFGCAEALLESAITPKNNTRSFMLKCVDAC